MKTTGSSGINNLLPTSLRFISQVRTPAFAVADPASIFRTWLFTKMCICFSSPEVFFLKKNTRRGRSSKIRCPGHARDGALNVARHGPGRVWRSRFAERPHLFDSFRVRTQVPKMANAKSGFAFLFNSGRVSYRISCMIDCLIGHYLQFHLDRIIRLVSMYVSWECYAY